MSLQSQGKNATYDSMTLNVQVNEENQQYYPYKCSAREADWVHCINSIDFQFYRKVLYTYSLLYIRTGAAKLSEALIC